MPWRPRAAAGRWLSDLRTVLAFLREHRGVPRAAHDRLAELARDKHVLVATRPPGATDGPPCAVTVIQPGGAITSVHAGWFGAALPDEREARLQAHAEAVRAAMVALAVALPAVRLVTSTSVLLATAVAGVAAYARLEPESGWRAALFAPRGRSCCRRCSGWRSARSSASGCDGSWPIWTGNPSQRDRQAPQLSGDSTPTESRRFRHFPGRQPCGAVL